MLCFKNNLVVGCRIFRFSINAPMKAETSLSIHLIFEVSNITLSSCIESELNCRNKLLIEDGDEYNELGKMISFVVPLNI